MAGDDPQGRSHAVQALFDRSCSAAAWLLELIRRFCNCMAGCRENHRLLIHQEAKVSTFNIWRAIAGSQKP